MTGNLEPEQTSPGESPPAGALRVELEWDGDLRFEARGRGGVPATVDGDGAAGPSPMEALLAALGACAAADIVEILRKARQPAASLSLRLTGARRREVPRRFTRIVAEVRIGGAVERARAERAVRLAFEKYCSVAASLDPAIPVEVELDVDGG